ncbi:MAG: CopG family transcriptional regulator [archaeon]|nr:CopG family transcriptional regulator [archaeon]
MQPHTEHSTEIGDRFNAKRRQEHATDRDGSLNELDLERSEDELDAQLADEAYAAFVKNPVTKPLADVMKEFGL